MEMPKTMETNQKTKNQFPKSIAIFINFEPQNLMLMSLNFGNKTHRGVLIRFYKY